MMRQIPARGSAMSRRTFACSVILALAVGASVFNQACGQKRIRSSAPAESSSKPSTTFPHTRYINPLYRRHLDDIVPGLNARVRVLAPARFDWEWAMPPGLLAITPKEVMAGYDPTLTAYQLFVPHNYRHGRSSPLVLFLSASASPEE